MTPEPLRGLRFFDCFAILEATEDAKGTKSFERGVAEVAGFRGVKFIQEQYNEFAFLSGLARSLLVPFVPLVVFYWSLRDAI